MTRGELLARMYQHFRQDKQLPVALYVQLTMAGVDPDKCQAFYEERNEDERR